MPLLLGARLASEKIQLADFVQSQLWCKIMAMVKNHVTSCNSHVQNHGIYGLLPSVLWHCWLGIRKSIQPVKIEWWGQLLAWLSVWSEVQIVCIWSSWCHCHPQTPLSLTSFKSRLVLPFQLTQDVLEKRPLNRCSDQGCIWRGVKPPAKISDPPAAIKNARGSTLTPPRRPPHTNSPYFYVFYVPMH